MVQVSPASLTGPHPPQRPPPAGSESRSLFLHTLGGAIVGTRSACKRWWCASFGRPGTRCETQGDVVGGWKEGPKRKQCGGEFIWGVHSSRVLYCRLQCRLFLYSTLLYRFRVSWFPLTRIGLASSTGVRFSGLADAVFRTT